MKIGGERGATKQAMCQRLQQTQTVYFWPYNKMDIQPTRKWGEGRVAANYCVVRQVSQMEMVGKIKTWKPFCPRSRLQSAKQCDDNIKEWRRGYHSLICEGWLHEDKQTSKHNLLLCIVDQGWTVRNLKCNFVFFLPLQPAVLPVHKSEIELWGNLGEISMKFQEKNSCQRGLHPH